LREEARRVDPRGVRRRPGRDPDRNLRGDRGEPGHDPALRLGPGARFLPGDSLHLRPSLLRAAQSRPDAPCGHDLHAAGMRAFLLAAGYGKRFRPVTETIPKPLVPFLNVPLLRQHLAFLKRHGILEAGVNLHHLGEKIERELRDRPADLPDVRFFPEPEILGTAGALRNAAHWLSGGDFLVMNTDTVIGPDLERLAVVHRKTGYEATLLVVENRDPDRYTPLQAEGDRITGFGGDAPDPLLYTGVCLLSPGLLD